MEVNKVLNHSTFQQGLSADTICDIHVQYP